MEAREVGSLTRQLWCVRALIVGSSDVSCVSPVTPSNPPQEKQIVSGLQKATGEAATLKKEAKEQQKQLAKKVDMLTRICR